MKKTALIILSFLYIISCHDGREKIFTSEKAKAISIFSDEIKFYDKIYHKSYNNCNSNKDCAEINIEYPELISINEIQDSINLFIKNEILNISFNEDVYSSLDELTDSLFSNFISVQKEFPNYHSMWYIKSKLTLSVTQKYFLSLKNETDVYTGGANSYYSISLTNFDLRNGKILALEDILENDNLPKLTKIAEEIFRKDKGIKNLFKDNGYWFENDIFGLNDNFAISDSGMIFIYNLYEIGPRSSGITKLFIPKKDLNSIVKIFN